MKKSNRLNILLVEILIATLFFALASTTILKTYEATRGQSYAAGIGNAAETALQNLAEICYASEAPEAALKEAGFVQDGDRYVWSGEDYSMTAEISEEKTEAGCLRTVTLSASIGERTILTLPSVRYLPEVTAS